MLEREGEKDKREKQVGMTQKSTLIKQPLGRALGTFTPFIRHMKFF